MLPLSKCSRSSGCVPDCQMYWKHNLLTRKIRIIHSTGEDSGDFLTNQVEVLLDGGEPLAFCYVCLIESADTEVFWNVQP